MMLVTGGVPAGDDFYEGRRKYVQELAEKLEKQEVALIGPRRTGKTSIIQTYFENLEKGNGRIPLYINLESCSTPYDIITEIGRKLLEQRSGLRSIFSNVTQRANDWVAKMKGHFEGAELTHTSGVGLKINLRHVLDQKLEALGTELKDLCGSTDEKIVIALDELPEAIWKYVNADTSNNRAERIKHIGILLSFFRDIRQTNRSSGKLRIIYSGSVNFVLTLKKLGFAEDHNDLAHFTIPFLNPEETVDVANQLMKGEGIPIQDPQYFEEVMKIQFGFTTPYYVQLFIEQLKNVIRAKQVGYQIQKEDVSRAYLQVLFTEFGPEYFYRRIETYHLSEKDKILKIVRTMAVNQTEKNESTTAKDLVLLLAPMSQLEIEDLLRSLFIEDFFQLVDNVSFDEIFSSSNKYNFTSNIIRAYWYRKLKAIQL